MRKQRGQSKGGTQGLIQYGGRLQGREPLKAGTRVRYQVAPSFIQVLQARDKLIE